jgi:hypothetical protein
VESDSDNPSGKCFCLQIIIRYGLSSFQCKGLRAEVRGNQFLSCYRNGLREQGRGIGGEKSVASTFTVQEVMDGA